MPSHVVKHGHKDHRAGTHNHNAHASATHHKHPHVECHVGHKNAKNNLLPGGIERYSRSAMVKKKGTWKKLGKATAGKTTAAATTKTKKIGGDKNGGTRTVPAVKAPRFYPTNDIKVTAKKSKPQKPRKHRATLVPGAVLILLSGKYRGKRVVCLDTLPSGLLLVSGPFNVNGVPLKRVDPAYCIGTSTQIDISGVKVPATVNDAFFKKPKSNKNGEFFEKDGDAGKSVSADRVAAQKEVDSQLNGAIAKIPSLKDYLRSQFTLRGQQYPHEMKF